MHIVASDVAKRAYVEAQTEAVQKSILKMGNRK